jgi:hypothetical protein
MEFTGVELAAPVENATTGLVENAAADEKCSGDGERSAVALGCSEDVDWWSGRAMERKARWSVVVERYHGAAMR